MTQNSKEGNKGRIVCPPPINNKIIREFPEDLSYNDYFNSVLSDFAFVKGFFPLLNICMLPTVKPKELYIYGWLLPASLCNTRDIEANIKRFGMYILAYYPNKYPEEDVEVEDICGVINWNLIPEEHRHIKIIDGRLTGLCTHHPDGEINDVPFKHRTVKILTSAWKLYYQYTQYINGGIWNLPDLPHGDKAMRILKKEGHKHV